MRIGVVTTSFPRWPGDYAGSFVEASVRRLLGAGHHVDVVAAGPPRGSGPGPEETAEAPDPMAATLGARARVVRVPVPRSCPPGPNLFYDEGAPEVLERGLPSSWVQATAFCAGIAVHVVDLSPGWDEIQAHWLLPCALLARAASRRVGEGEARARSAPPVHGYAHSGDVALLERMPGGPAVAGWLGRELAELTFASADLHRRFVRLSGGTVRARTEIAPVILPPVKVAASPVTMGPERGEVIVAVGRLVPIKGFDILLRATALAEARSGQKATVVILGDGPERDRLSRFARRLDVALHLPGFIPHGDVAGWLLAARVYVQPSRRLWNGRTEGLPLSTLEALALGVRVISSDSGGLADLTAGPRGPAIQVFPAGDHHALAAILEGVLCASRHDARPSGVRKAAVEKVSGA